MTSLLFGCRGSTENIDRQRGNLKAHYYEFIVIKCHLRGTHFGNQDCFKDNSVVRDCCIQIEF